MQHKPSHPARLLGRLFILLVVPAAAIMAAQLYFTRRWYPACPDFLRTLIWNAWFLCPLVPALLFAKNAHAATRLWRILAAACTLIFLPVALLCLGHILLFRCLPSFLSLQAILQTDIVESGNFVAAYTEVSVVVSVALPAIIYAALLYAWWKQGIPAPVPPSKWKRPVLGLAVLVFFAVPMAAWKANGRGIEKNSFVRAHYFLRTVSEFATALRNQRNNADMVRRAAEPVDFGDIRLLDAAERRTYVLILGEGASRAHMSLYGYSRPTSTPLDALRNELVVYDNVVSMFGTTAPSLNAAFLFPQNRQKQQGIASILTLHRQAGFKTYWLTNNLAEEKGRGAAWFAASADVLINKNLAVSFTQLSTYDEILLPELEKALQDNAPNKFIVLHLAGMHPTYDFRFPPERKTFADNDITGLYRRGELSDAQIRKINAYDNAMTYNNANVRAVIDAVAKNGGTAYVLTLSDHSQQLYEVPEAFQGHAPTGGTRFMYDIPFFVWLSPEYRERNREFAATLPAGRKRFWKMDEGLGHSLAELSRINFGGFRPERSIFSKEYREPDAKLGDGTDYFSLP